METVNVHQAKTNLSRLLEAVQQGQPFVIAKAGKPIARVTSIDATSPESVKRIGFLKGQIGVPEDFDEMGATEIAAIFGTNDASAP